VESLHSWPISAFPSRTRKYKSVALQINTLRSDRDSVLLSTVHQRRDRPMKMLRRRTHTHPPLHFAPDVGQRPTLCGRTFARARG
jgi:hypothetical protein